MGGIQKYYEVKVYWQRINTQMKNQLIRNTEFVGMSSETQWRIKGNLKQKSPI